MESEAKAPPDGEREPKSMSGSFSDLLSARYSCRGFLDRRVPRTDLERILETAQKTPSWCNTQPWHVVVTEGAGTSRFVEALVQHVQDSQGVGAASSASPTSPGSDFPFPREYAGDYLQRRRECGFQLYESVGIQRGDVAAADRQRLQNFRLFGAPHVAIVTSPEALGVYGAIDCGAYVNNFMLALRSAGIASIAQASLAAYSGFVRDYFSLAPARWVVCGISFGYEDADHPANRFRTRRAQTEEVVTWVDR